MAKLVDAPVIFYRSQYCKSRSYYKNNMETGAIRRGGSSPSLPAKIPIIDRYFYFYI